MRRMEKYGKASVYTRLHNRENTMAAVQTPPKMTDRPRRSSSQRVSRAPSCGTPRGVIKARFIGIALSVLKLCASRSVIWDDLQSRAVVGSRVWVSSASLVVQPMAELSGGERMAE